MPVIDIRGNFDHISGQKFPSLSAALLIEADAADRNQKLSAGMTMPVVAASWLECDIGVLSRALRYPRSESPSPEKP